MKQLWNKQWLIKKIDQKEANEVKKNYKQYLNRRKEVMRETEFRVADLFGDILINNSISQEKNKNLIIFSRNGVNINSKLNIPFLQPRKEMLKNYERVLLLNSQSFSN